MSLKSYRKELMQERANAYNLYNEIVHMMDVDMGLYKFGSSRFNQASRYYDNYRWRLLRLCCRSQRSMSKKRIRNIMDAMNYIYDNWRQIHSLLSVY